MYTVCKIKNLTGTILTLHGHEFSVGEIYTIQETVRKSWASSDEVISKIASEDFQIHDGNGAVSGISEQLNWLKSYLPHTTEIEKQPPFAEPLYRTKRSKTSEVLLVPPGATRSVDFILPSDLYVSGGCLIVKNGEFKDWVKASVYDYYSGIPEAYRSALCEDWPTVAEYIPGEWLKYLGEMYTTHDIDTYPLNAKITTGLSLRVTYTAHDGALTYIGEWDSGTTYSVDDVVDEDGQAYKCVAGNTGEALTDTDYWETVDSREVLVNYSLTVKL